ncbi:MAG: GTPase ObgE [Atribacterota bacterium]|nr:GTPase ObgE [Atribacterota bacterium]
MFVDQAIIKVQGGRGGDGAIHFRREKFVPYGGPGGGKGGDGGNVFLRASDQKKTLYDVSLRPFYQAPSGRSGAGNNKSGARGEDVIIEVPVGTQVFDLKTGELLADLVYPGMEVLIARGGKGGRGNASFVSSLNRAPRIAERGEDGEVREILLELKLIADVGLTGLPNAGKSTLLSVVSDAKPRIASFPFSTLSPTLGVVVHREEKFVMVDIPGIIEGASQGAGLGLDFLRHVERVKLLLCLVDLSGDSPWRDFSVLRQEFAQYGHALTEKPFLVVGTKLDVTGARENWERFWAIMAQNHLEGIAISAVTGEGVTELLDMVLMKLRELREEPAIEASTAVAEKRARQRTLYRFNSQYLVRLIEEVHSEQVQNEDLLNLRLRESGFLQYFRMIKPESEIEIGERVFIWNGKGLRLKRDNESARTDDEK